MHYIKLTMLPSMLQIQDPTNGYQVHERAVSSGDHSFEAQHDGKYIYCFSNEHWSAASKEVSFNVHGIVYVPEAEAPSDPLEAEGALASTLSPFSRRCREETRAIMEWNGRRGV